MSNSAPCHGRIIEVFIPGYCDEHGLTHFHMDAEYIGFVIELASDALSFHSRQLIIIERANGASASMMKGDTVVIPEHVLCQLPGEGWDIPNKVFLNLSGNTCIQKG